MSKRDEMTRLLARAQAGDEDAHRQVAVYCFERYRSRLRRFQALDPAIAPEDMEMTFFEAIMKAVPHADGRGDDFYHIGQRGVWAVQSEMRAVRTMMANRAFLTGRPRMDGDEVRDPLDIADPLVLDTLEVVMDYDEATTCMRIVCDAPLKPRARQALGLIIEDPELNPVEPGFNKTLAEKMGVSQQRASQVVQELEEAYHLNGRTRNRKRGA